MPLGFTPPKTIQGKLILNTLLGVLSALFISSIALLALDITQYRQYLRYEMIGLGRVIAVNCVPAIRSGDRAAATLVLQSLHRDPRVQASYLLVPGSGVFASFERASWKGALGTPKPPQEGSEAIYERNQLVVYSSVRVAGKTAGWVVLYVGLGAFFTRIWIFVGIVLVISAVSALIAWALTRRFQHIILRPIQELSVAAKLISHEKNYRFRVVKRQDDEIGTLVDFFNEMLRQIQDRETELTRSRDDLEDRVAARTRQLKAEVDERKKAQQVVSNLLMKISDDNEKLVRLDEMKSDFLSIVSHELRTPLTAISGYLKLLARGEPGPVNDTQKEYLQTVLRNSDRLNHLVNDLLDLSRLESGGIQLKYAHIDAGTLLEQSARGLRSLAEKKKVQLVVLKPSPPFLFEADEARMEQALVNLLGNSVKFTPAKGRVEIGARLEDRNGTTWAVLWIHDNGVGIPQESLQRIFDKFYQAENSSTRKAGGTGLGLAITQQLVEAHGGTIQVESRESQGSMFWISVPAVRPKETKA